MIIENAVNTNDAEQYLDSYLQRRKEQFTYFCMVDPLLSVTSEVKMLLRIQEAICYLAIQASVSSIYNNRNNSEFKSISSKIYMLDENLSHCASWNTLKKIYRKMRWTRDNKINLSNQDYLDFMCLGTLLYVFCSDKKNMKNLLAKKEIWARLLSSGAANIGFSKLVCKNQNPLETAQRYIEEPLSNAELRKNLRINLLEAIFYSLPLQNLLKLLFISGEGKGLKMDPISLSRMTISCSEIDLHSEFWKTFSNYLGDLIEYNLFAPLFAFVPAGDPNKPISSSDDYDGPQFHENLYTFCSSHDIQSIFKDLQPLIATENDSTELSIPMDFESLKITRRGENDLDSEIKKQCCN